MRKTWTLPCVAVLLSGCADLVDGESLRVDVCEQRSCDLGTTLSFAHPVLEELGRAREGTLRAGGTSVAFACDASGAGAGDGWACVPASGSVRFAQIARDRPATLEVSVRFPETNLGFDGPVGASYAETCEGACVDGNALVLLEVQGAMPAACEPTADGCSAENCRRTRETCLFLPPWVPNYTRCENVTGEAVEDYASCAASCAERQAGAALTCALQWAESCQLGTGFEEAVAACGSCDEGRAVDPACAKACSDDRRACDGACPSSSIAACVDCSASCGLAYAGCLEACSGA